MTLAEEYERQGEWRNWDSYLKELPVKNTDVVLDLGCGTGQVTRLLGERCLQVIGVDHNPELLKIAEQHNNLKNISFINSDLSQRLNKSVPKSDGIWCSFTAAYFPDFKPVLSIWTEQLKPGGWIAFVEVDNLFGHHPLKTGTIACFKAHYKKLRDKFVYDFEMGSKLHSHLIDYDFTIIFEQDMNDSELAFHGRADDYIINAWSSRLDRMTGFQKAMGISQFVCIKKDFLNCLRHKDHSCTASVKFIVAKKRV